jgi:hypothetical protein
MSAKDIVLAVVIPLILAELGPWCGWLGRKLLPWAARLRYGNGDRASIRAEEWCDDLGQIPGQLSKLGYSLGQLAVGATVASRRQLTRRARLADAVSYVDIERHALEQALSHYQQLGYAVSDVSASHSYDLQAIRDDAMRHIELKASTRVVRDVLLTASEIAHARAGTLTDLVVIDRIKCVRLKDGTIQARGGRCRILPRETWIHQVVPLSAQGQAISTWRLPAATWSRSWRHPWRWRR